MDLHGFKDSKAKKKLVEKTEAITFSETKTLRHHTLFSKASRCLTLLQPIDFCSKSFIRVNFKECLWLPQLGNRCGQIKFKTKTSPILK